jgi:hypothetical protein
MRTRVVGLVSALCLFSLIARAEDTPLAAAQKLFDAMSAHDGAAARALFVPGATLASVDAAGRASVLPFEKFAEHIGSAKQSWLERIWNPMVLEHENIAVVWAEYDFHLGGKFSHCGLDSFSLLKTEGGWKIAYISDTRQKSGCKASPLGPPKA